MYPVIDLNEVTTNSMISVAVGESTGANAAGTVTITIKNAAPGGGHLILTKNVTNLNGTIQVVPIANTPQTGKIHHVTAVLVLASAESSNDDEFIQL